MHPTILSFWANQVARGEKRQAVHAIISTGGVQPIGYCVGWALTRRRAQKQMDKYAARVGGDYLLVRCSVHPTKEGEVQP